MRSLPVWLGLSTALHVALAIGLWAAARTAGIAPSWTERMSVVEVALVEASTVACATPCEPAPAPLEANSLDIPIRPAIRAVATMQATLPEPSPDAVRAELLLVPSFHLDPALARSTADQIPARPVPAAAESSLPEDHGLFAPRTPSSVALSPKTGSPDGAALDDYRPMVLALLQRAKRYPLAAERRGLEGTVEIAFIIAQDGRLSEPEVIVSSRHAVLDRAALDLVRRVGIVPPPPDPSPLRFAARIQYTLHTEASSPSTSTKGASP